MFQIQSGPYLFLGLAKRKYPLHLPRLALTLSHLFPAPNLRPQPPVAVAAVLLCFCVCVLNQVDRHTDLVSASCSTPPQTNPTSSPHHHFLTRTLSHRRQHDNIASQKIDFELAQATYHIGARILTLGHSTRIVGANKRGLLGRGTTILGAADNPTPAAQSIPRFHAASSSLLIASTAAHLLITLVNSRSPIPIQNQLPNASICFHKKRGGTNQSTTIRSRSHHGPPCAPEPIFEQFGRISIQLWRLIKIRNNVFAGWQVHSAE